MLKNRGVYICISYGDPDIRNHYFEDKSEKYDWGRKNQWPYKIFKPTIDHAEKEVIFNDKDKEKNKDYYHYVYILGKVKIILDLGWRRDHGCDWGAVQVFCCHDQQCECYEVIAVLLNNEFRVFSWLINITYMSEKKYTFVVEWFDPSASLIKQFYFTYFVPTNQIEMVLPTLCSTILRITKYSWKKYNTLR